MTTTTVCPECWFGDCKNCTGRNCWHAERGEHQIESGDEPENEDDK